MGQHYLPQRYLRQFAAVDHPDKIWMYDKSKRDSKLLPIKIVAQKSGFYFEEDESALNEKVEGPAVQPLDKLICGNDIDREERLRVTLYLHMLLLRVPKAREKRRDILKRELPDLLKDWENERLNDPLFSNQYYNLIQSVLDPWRKDDFSELPRQDIRELLMGLPVSQDVLDRLYAMTWRLLKSEDNNSFITGDNPIFFPKWLGLKNFDVELSVPLSSSVALHLSYQGKAETTLFIPAEPRHVNEINRRTARGAGRFLFCHRNEEWITKMMRVAQPRVKPLRW